MSSHSDLSRTLNRAAAIASMLIGVAAGCDSCCTDEVLQPGNEPACVADAVECADEGEFRFGTCQVGGCAADSDCCPGNRCRTDLNLCFPRLLDSEFECETSADCQDPAQVCAAISIGVREPLLTCIYESCAGDRDCGFGRTCFEGKCVLKPPCDGGCPDGNICEINSNSCHPLPTAEGAFASSCTQPCNDGLLVLVDENNMTGDACCELACECAPLPPVVPTRIGRHARVAVNNNSVLVSAYDAEFGDLVIVRHKLDGVPSGTEYVDGVPAEPPTGDPAGPRGGVRTPGPNVGTHTSIAMDASGFARVAYYDVDNNALKVAIEGPVGVWRSHVVDGAASTTVGQVGTFTDVRVQANGTIYVSYLAHNTVIAGQNGPATGLKLARSRTPAPQSAADWELFVIDARPFVTPEGARPEPTEMPRGRGLHSNLIFDGADVLLAAYDASDGDVRVSRFTATAQVTTVVLDGDATGGRISGDVGRFPAMGIVADELVVVYEDFSRHTLRVWRGPKATPGTGGAYGIADQVREPTLSGSHFVGAGARLTTTGNRPVLVYQDASNNDLRFATLEGQAFVATTVLSDGAHGYYSDVVVAGTSAYVVSMVAELDQRGIERSRLRLDVQQVP